MLILGRKTLIAANWKMNKTVKEAIEFAMSIKPIAKASKDVEVVICPSYTALPAVGRTVAKSRVHLGAQNMHFKPTGAFTGEISGQMLKDVGCKYVILGHSERRNLFHEDNDIVNQKVKAALEISLNPILCIGEMFEERDAGNTKQVLEHQLQNSLKGINAEEMKGIAVAYEPIWAIGTGRNATAEQIDDAVSYIRHILEKMFGKVADEIRIVYGGSVTPENAPDILAVKQVDGCLVGAASLDVEKFSAIIKCKS